MSAAWGGGFPRLLAWVCGGLLLAAVTSPAAAPRLVSSTPANNATAVAVNSTVVFVFDVAMLPNDALNGIPGLAVGALAWSGNVTADNFEYTWSDDGKTLTCTYSDDLPGEATITWKLNPPGVFSGLDLTSADGTPLPTGTYSGSFTTAAASGGGGGGNTAPKLVSVSPVDGAKDVAVASTIQFVFDQPMTANPLLGGFPPFVKGAISWTGTGLTASKFTYAWSNGDKTLTCTYAGGLPGTTAITWELNPADAQAGLELSSANGDVLPNTKGGFTTGAGGGGGGTCNPNPTPDGWGSYGLNFLHQYTQTSSAAPLPAASSPFLFGATVRAPDAGPTVTAASYTGPGKAPVALEGIFGTWFASDEFATEAALDAAHPAGAYVLKFTQTGQAERSIPMNVPATKPPVPTIANFAETQSVNAAADFTLRWNPFTGGAAPNDGITLSITDGSDEVFLAPDPCVPRDLAVTATSIVVPANTLAKDKTYEVTLSFGRNYYFSTNTVSQMTGFGTIARMTQFTLKTGTGGGGGTSDPARFIAFRVLPNGNPELTLQGTATKSYTVQRTSNLLNPTWTAAGTVTMSAAGTVVFEDAQTAGARPLFYRAVAN